MTKKRESLWIQHNSKLIGNKELSLELSPAKRSYQYSTSSLTTFCQRFPKDSIAFHCVQNILFVLKKIESIQKSTEKNANIVEDLKQEILWDLNNIKLYLETQNSDQATDLKEMQKHIEKNLKDQLIIQIDGVEASTGTQYLHSIGFDQIVRMINMASAHEPEWMSRTGTILILDNNPNTSQSLMRRLTREGHTVILAENEHQAMSCLAENTIEALLIDYLVLKDNLYEFLHKLESEFRFGYIPIIIIGAPESAEVMKKLLESGIGDYLAKPVNPALLRMRVHAALEKKYAFKQRVQRLQEMQRTRRELEASIQNLPDGFAIFDQNNQMVMHNDKIFEFYPHLNHRNEMIRGGLTFDRFLEANVAAGIYIFEDFKSGRQWLEDKKMKFLLPASQWEESLTSGLVLGITTYRTPDGGGALVVKDISKDKAHHQDLTFLAYHDSLTGLPNRKAFHQKLTQSIMNAQTSKDQLLAVLFLDLDGFKDINDSYGHEMGDWLLNQVGYRLRHCVRGDDMIARFGGDEFCIILKRAANRAKVTMVANRILKAIFEPFIRDGVTLRVGVSIGIGLYTLGIEDSETLLKEADAAMYAVKQTGKGRFCFFDELVTPVSPSEFKPAFINRDDQIKK